MPKWKDGKKLTGKLITVGTYLTHGVSSKPNTVGILECGHALVGHLSDFEGPRARITGYRCNYCAAEATKLALLERETKPEPKREKTQSIDTNARVLDMLSRVTSALEGLDKRLTEVEDAKTRPSTTADPLEATDPAEWGGP